MFKSKLFKLGLKLGLTILSSIVLAYVISFLSEKVNILERFTIAINDVDFSDVYYKYRPTPKPDTNVVIVNIGFLDRAALAGLLKTISENNPKVIGGNVIFGEAGDSINMSGTDLLINEIKTIKKFILVNSYQGRSEDGFDLVEGQSPLIGRYVYQGLANFNIAEDDREYGTVRSFEPITDINGNKQMSFGFLVASQLDSTVLHKAYEGNMMIKWYGYGNVFKYFDWHQIQNKEFKRSDIEGKIILLGFMGERIGIPSPTDQFYSPLNSRMVGRSLPDMYGVEIQANIIKMIIDNDYIFQTKTSDYIFSFIFVFLLTMLLIWIQTKFEKQYSIVSKIALLVFIDCMVLGTISIFAWTDGGVKLLIGDGLFIMVFIPDTYEFLESNLFNRKK